MNICQPLSGYYIHVDAVNGDNCQDRLREGWYHVCGQDRGYWRLSPTIRICAPSHLCNQFLEISKRVFDWSEVA
jgi:hypothetical protein